MNEQGRNTEVEMWRVWQAVRSHFAVCGAGNECEICVLCDNLAADPRREEWERAGEAQAHAQTLRRQTEQEQLRERQDD